MTDLYCQLNPETAGLYSDPAQFEWNLQYLVLAGRAALNSDTSEESSVVLLESALGAQLPAIFYLGQSFPHNVIVF